MKRLKTYLANAWQPVAIAATALIAAALLLTFRIGSLVGFDSNELSLRLAVTGHHFALMHILRDAVYLPYKLMLFCLQFLPFHGAGSLRMIGVIWALVGISSFYYILRHWHTTRIAILCTTLFVTSSWLLHITRYASPLAMYVASVTLFALWIWLQEAIHKRAALMLLCIASALAFYIPGFIWFIVPAIIWQRHNLVHAFRRVSLTYGLITLGATIVLLVPLILSIAWPLPGTTHLHEAYMFSGIPARLPTMQHYIQNFADVWKDIFISSNGNPVFFVGNLPFVTIFGGLMFIVGLFVFATSIKLDRSRMIFAILLGGGLLIALGGSVSISLLLPFIYLVIAEGVSRLLQEWLRVFPRNPIARSLGIGMVALVLAGAVLYQLTAYFTAWPHDITTKTTFSHRL